LRSYPKTVKYGGDAVPIPGANSILEHLSLLQVPWGIVTSWTKPLATGWLEILQLAHPSALIIAEVVQNGKPDPACYLLWKEMLGLEGEVLVFEDAPAGIRAGKKVGCKVLALTTTHAVEELWKAGADWIVKDLESVGFGFEKLRNGRRSAVMKILDEGLL